MNRRRSRILLLAAIFVTVLLWASTACSPGYIIKAGIEEARILWRSQDINEILNDPNTTDEQRRKFTLVLEARAFAEELGLKPGDSFTEYSQVDREILLWVLSGAEKTSFEAVTWWFPIVGRVPYKGFFKEYDAKRAAKRLKRQGYDIYLRPSPAFSTLGWFDDPLLSTVLAFDEISLVDTVIHEIVHNTVWIKSNAPFNETLAHFIGLVGAVKFFETHEPESTELIAEARARIPDAVRFSLFVTEIKAELSDLYAAKLTEQQILEKREEIFTRSIARWNELRETMQSKSYRRRKLLLNNAVLIALDIYYQNLNLFSELYEVTGQDLKNYVNEIKALEKLINSDEIDAYSALRERVGGSLVVD